MNIATTQIIEISSAIFLEITPVTKGRILVSLDSLSTSISIISFDTKLYIAEKSPIKKIRKISLNSIITPISMRLKAPKTGAIEKAPNPGSLISVEYSDIRLGIK